MFLSSSASTGILDRLGTQRFCESQEATLSVQLNHNVVTDRRLLMRGGKSADLLASLFVGGIGFPTDAFAVRPVCRLVAVRDHPTDDLPRVHDDLYLNTTLHDVCRVLDSS